MLNYFKNSKISKITKSVLFVEAILIIVLTLGVDFFHNHDGFVGNYTCPAKQIFIAFSSIVIPIIFVAILLTFCFIIPDKIETLCYINYIYIPNSRAPPSKIINKFI